MTVLPEGFPREGATLRIIELGNRVGNGRRFLNDKAILEMYQINQTAMVGGCKTDEASMGG